MSKVTIGSARYGETGGYNQKVGDQKGGAEVSTQALYNHTKGWVVLRAKSDEHRLRLAQDMLYACNNDNIGYDMTDRLSLINIVEKLGYDCSKVTTPTECDCSSLVRVCIAYATGKKLGNFTTANEKDVLLNSGLFDLVEYNADKLLIGDILVTKTQGHTAIVVSTSEKIETSSKKYLPTYTGKSNSIVDALKSLGINSTLDYRKKLAVENGISTLDNYAMNVELLKRLKQGKLHY